MDYKHLKKWKDAISTRFGERARFLDFMFEPPIGDNDKTADLHGHTKTYSDGKRSADYYTKTAEKSLDIFSITDHDSIGQNDRLNGVEVTCKLDPDNEIEILVYNYDYKKAQELISNGTFPFLDREFKYARNVHLAKQRLDICNELKLADKKLTLADILQIQVPNSDGKLETLTLEQIGVDTEKFIDFKKPLPKTVFYNGKEYNINYSFLIRKTFEQIHNSKNGLAFLNKKAEEDSTFNPHSDDHFLKRIVSNKKGELYVESAPFWPTAKDVINFAKASGGVAILAHPFGYNRKINIPVPELLEKAKSLGIDGVEVWHGFNQSDEVEFLYKWAYLNELLITMGSDTHGFMSTQGGKTAPGTFPGVGLESRYAEGNVDEATGSLYNLHYFGTGAWRGEQRFNHKNIPSSLSHLIQTTEKEM